MSNLRATEALSLSAYVNLREFSTGMRDYHAGRQRFDEVATEGIYAYEDGRQFAAVFPGITSKEIRATRQALHVQRAISEFFHLHYLQV